MNFELLLSLVPFFAILVSVLIILVDRWLHWKREAKHQERMLKDLEKHHNYVMSVIANKLENFQD